MENDFLSENFEWYLVGNNDTQILGPFSERDLDVMWKTGEINSQTKLCKEGMPEWVPLYKIERLKKQIIEEEEEFLKNIMHQEHHHHNERLNKHIDLDVARVGNSSKSKLWLSNQIEKPLPLLSALENDAPSQNKSIIPTVASAYEEKRRESMNFDPHMPHKPDTVMKNPITHEDKLAMQTKEKLEKLIEEERRKKEQQEEEDLNLLAKRTKQYATMTGEQIKKIEKNRKKAQKQKEKQKQRWYNAKINSNLYVKGLPTDITLEEYKEFFLKAGALRLNSTTGEEKIKLYKDESGKLKGDGLVGYAKPDSIPLAMTLLHEKEIRPGYPVFLEEAKFEQKGEYKKRERMKIDNITKIKIKTAQEKMFTWNEEDDELQGLKIVIIENVFSLDPPIEDENFFDELEQELLAECEANLGPVKRIKVFRANPDGIVLIKFEKPASAEACIRIMNGRFFDGRELKSFYYDGKTNYDHAHERTEDEQMRLDTFGKWLESQIDTTQILENINKEMSSGPPKLKQNKSI